MSRCFPFPPPGYEKSARTDVVDTLAKEESKEKKNKKEKRDKKRKDKEGSKDKHRDKKDRKEKHKDKKEKDKNKDKNKTSDGRKPENKINDQIREKSAEVTNLAGEHTNKKVLEELDRRIKDEQGEENRIGSDAMDQRNFLSSPYAEKVRTGGDDRRHEKHKESSKFVGNEPTPLDQRRQEGMLRAFEKDMEKGMGITEINKEKGDKHKDREKEKKRKDKDRDKAKKKEKEKVNVKLKEKADLKQIEQNQHGLRSSEGVDVLKAISRPPLLNDGKFGCLIEDNKKRKEIEMNGFTHESGNWPNKLPRVAASSHLPLENGRKPERLCMPNLFGHDRQGASDSKLMIERKEDIKINGTVEAGISSDSLMTPAGGKVHESGEASAPKPPHPDVKYLNQIYDIPKVEEWCDLDDKQDWLFGSGDTNGRLKKPMVNPEGCEIAPQVWAEAVLLRPTDIYALPYVIPR